MATIGTDCHITLQHSSVNSGTAVGFLIATDKRGPMVRVGRRRWGEAIWADQGASRRSLSLTVTGLPRMKNPNGSEHSLTPAQIRTYLESFWAVKASPLTLADALGSFTVGWQGLEERRYSDGSEFDLRFEVY